MQSAHNPLKSILTESRATPGISRLYIVKVLTSSSISAGSVSSSHAMLARFFSPPDKPRRIPSPTLVPAQLFNSKSLNKCSTWAFLSETLMLSGNLKIKIIFVYIML